MYGLDSFTNTRTGEKFRAIVRNKEPQAQTDVMVVKELEAKTAEGDIIAAENGSEYFALEHDFEGLSARPAVRSYGLAIAQISDSITIFRPQRDKVDCFGRPVADQLEKIAENVKAVVENKARVELETTPVRLAKMTIRRVLCSLCAVEMGDRVAVNGSKSLAKVINVDSVTWNGAMLILMLECA